MDENPMGTPTQPAGSSVPPVDAPVGGGQDQPTMPPPTPPAGGPSMPGMPEPSDGTDVGTGGGVPPVAPGM
ncbi:MAG: hypothetical protein Q8R11_01230 [bacterium]|nr:hypothetical protein [bacterium]